MGCVKCEGNISAPNLWVEKIVNETSMHKTHGLTKVHVQETSSTNNPVKYWTQVLGLAKK